jgi:hypothetical protein
MKRFGPKLIIPSTVKQSDTDVLPLFFAPLPQTYSTRLIPRRNSEPSPSTTDRNRKLLLNEKSESCMVTQISIGDRQYHLGDGIVIILDPASEKQLYGMIRGFCRREDKWYFYAIWLRAEVKSQTMPGRFQDYLDVSDLHAGNSSISKLYYCFGRFSFTTTLVWNFLYQRINTNKLG